MQAGSKPNKFITFQVVSNPERWVTGDEPAYLAVTDRNWSSYYSKAPEGSNFSAFLYIMVSAGMKPNPGYTVKIKRLERIKKEIRVSVELNEPVPGKFYPQVMVNPVAVVEVALTSLEHRDTLRFVFIDRKGRQIAEFKLQV